MSYHYVWRPATHELRQRQNERHGFKGLHGAKRVARGDYAGGYRHLVLLSDGALLCGACVRENWRQIVESYHRNAHGDGWRPVAVTHDGALESREHCADCGVDLGPEPEPQPARELRVTYELLDMDSGNVVATSQFLIDVPDPIIGELEAELDELLADFYTDDE